MPATDTRTAKSIPITAGARYPLLGLRLSPMIVAAAATALSSLSVVGNATRLPRHRIEALPDTEPRAVEPQVETGAQRPNSLRSDSDQADRGGRSSRSTPGRSL